MNGDVKKLVPSTDIWKIRKGVSDFVLFCDDEAFKLCNGEQFHWWNYRVANVMERIFRGRLDNWRTWIKGFGQTNRTLGWGCEISLTAKTDHSSVSTRCYNFRLRCWLENLCTRRWREWLGDEENFSFFKIEKKKVKNIIGVAVCVNLYGSENGVSLTCGGLAEKRRLAEGTSTWAQLSYATVLCGINLRILTHWLFKSPL